MFIILGAIYYSICGDGVLWQKIFVIVATILFVGNHFLVHSSQLQSYQEWFFSTDLVLTTCYGFFFAAQTDLYLIMFGILAVTLFIRTAQRRVLYTYTILFFMIWNSILYFTYTKTNQFDLPSNLVNFMFIVFCAAVGSLINKLLSARETVAEQYQLLSKSHHELSNVHEQLRAYSQQVEELTVIRERNQIAREIHDTVGHKMTAMIVQLQLSRELMALDLDKSKETIQKCEILTRQALEEIRTSVRTLREDEGIHSTLLASIQTILKEFSQSAKIQVSLDLTGDPAKTPTSLQPTINRIIQESLTNSKRHGDATQCHVHVDCRPEFIDIFIEDNGIGVKKVQPSFGLINMRERVLEHGGTIQFESTEGKGFKVKVELPLKTFHWSMGGHNDQYFNCR
jgi:signal transduction histidine kinase